MRATSGLISNQSVRPDKDPHRKQRWLHSICGTRSVFLRFHKTPSNPRNPRFEQEDLGVALVSDSLFDKDTASAFCRFQCENAISKTKTKMRWLRYEHTFRTEQAECFLHRHWPVYPFCFHTCSKCTYCLSFVFPMLYQIWEAPPVFRGCDQIPQP